MRIPAIRGIIDRRILANYRVDPDCMAAILPKPFRPQIYQGYAIGGICLIRLKNIRPKLLPVPWGIGSENAAHRIAVEWDENGETKTGVYIPRRDTNSRLNAWVGGTLFPGLHHLSSFDINENGDSYSVSMTSSDRSTHVHVVGSAAESLDPQSVFGTLESASRFFESGSLGYSDTNEPGRFDGLELYCPTWKTTPLNVTEIRSSYFDNQEQFPSGTVQFDCALLMRDIDHEWHGRSNLCCPTPKLDQPSN